MSSCPKCWARNWNQFILWLELILPHWIAGIYGIGWLCGFIDYRGYLRDSESWILETLHFPCKGRFQYLILEIDLGGSHRLFFFCKKWEIQGEFQWYMIAYCCLLLPTDIGNSVSNTLWKKAVLYIFGLEIFGDF